MNYPRYCNLYSRFHGCTTFRTEQGVIILDFADMAFDKWNLIRMYRFDDIHMTPKHSFIQALQVFLKSQAPITVFCQNDSWFALSGNNKFIVPILEENATFQMYATPYFVQDPSIIAEYLQSNATPSSDTIYMYKNCILYLDKEDVPFPGGCYFKNCDGGTQPLYRICLLSNEPIHKAVLVALEWKTRRDVMTVPFLTKEITTTPSMISFYPITQPYFADEQALSTGSIQKRLSVHNPHCLIQDVLMSYQRNQSNDENVQNIQNIGLVIEWPFRLAFEGTRTHSSPDKNFVAIAVNGVRPMRTLFVRYPYETFIEYNEVPSIPWIMIRFVPTILKLPADVEKVSVDSTIIGYKYKNAFYCFGIPVLEGRPTVDLSRNMDCLFTIPKQLNPTDQIKNTFCLNEKYTLNEIQAENIPYTAWCIVQTDEAHKYLELPNQLLKLVSAWIKMFKKQWEVSNPQPIDINMVQIALTLARHKICFTTKIEKNNKKPEINLSNEEIELCLSPDEAKFINSRRVSVEPVDEAAENAQGGCLIM